MNWIVLILVGFIVLALLLFIIFRNQKDKEQLEGQLNQDFHKSKEEEGDEDTEQALK